MGLILLIVLIVLVFGSHPNWGWHQAGYGPFGILLFILLLIVILNVAGDMPHRWAW